MGARLVFKLLALPAVADLGADGNDLARRRVKAGRDVGHGNVDVAVLDPVQFRACFRAAPSAPQVVGPHDAESGIMVGLEQVLLQRDERRGPPILSDARNGDWSGMEPEKVSAVVLEHGFQVQLAVDARDVAAHGVEQDGQQCIGQFFVAAGFGWQRSVVQSSSFWPLLFGGRPKGEVIDARHAALVRGFSAGVDIVRQPDIGVLPQPVLGANGPARLGHQDRFDSALE